MVTRQARQRARQSILRGRHLIRRPGLCHGGPLLQNLLRRHDSAQLQRRGRHGSVLQNRLGQHGSTGRMHSSACKHSRSPGSCLGVRRPRNRQSSTLRNHNSKHQMALGRGARLGEPPLQNRQKEHGSALLKQRGQHDSALLIRRRRRGSAGRRRTRKPSRNPGSCLGVPQPQNRYSQPNRSRRSSIARRASRSPGRGGRARAAAPYRLRSHHHLAQALWAPWAPSAPWAWDQQQ